MKKLKDLVVKVGSYEKNGETKNRYENVGSLMEGEHGQFIFLKKTFSPAGVESRGFDIIISMFDVKKKNVDSNEQDEIPF